MSAEAVPSPVDARPGRGSMWALAGKLVAGLALLASNFVLARMLSPAQFGAYLVVFSTVTIGAVVAQLGMGPAVVRRVAEFNAAGRPAAAAAVARRAVAIGALGAAITAGLLAGGLGAWFARTVIGEPELAAVSGLVAVWLVATAVHTLIGEVFRGYHDVRGAVLFGGATGGLLSPLLATLGFVSWWWWRGEAGLAQVLAIAAGAALVVLACGAWALRGRVRAHKDPGDVHAGSLLAIAAPLWLSGVATVLLVSVDVWILAAARGTGPVALYGAAARLASLIVLPFVVVNAATAPLVADLYSRGAVAQLQARLRIVTTVSALPAVGLFAVFVIAGAPLMGLLYGPYYRDGALLLVILAAGQLASVLTGPCGVALMMTGRQVTMLAITLGAGGATVAVAVWAAGRFGATGLALAMSGGMIVQNLAMWYALRQATGLDTRVAPGLVREWRTWRPW